ncbi:hypothetical protein, partial [Proteiniphilum sp. UBA5375]
MKKLIVILTLGIIVISACKESKKEAEESVIPENSAISQDLFIPENEGYSLFWEDNFEGTELDTLKWKVRGTG